MMGKNREIMNQMLSFIDDYYARTGKSPTCREIAGHVPLGRSSVHNYLLDMQNRNMLEYNGRDIVTPGIRALRDGARRVGIVGDIRCGLPEDPAEVLQEYINIPLDLVGRDDVYILIARGDSMIGAGIDEGDLVLVRRQEEARIGDLVVAYIEGEGCTLKRLWPVNGELVLHPENNKYSDIPAKNCRIQGKALWIFKNVS